MLSRVDLQQKKIENCAAWISSIPVAQLCELDGAMHSGVKQQKLLGKSEEYCAKYIIKNFRKQLSGIISFNQEMGIDFQ